MPFEAHIELVDCFLAHRGTIVEALEPLLNAQRKPIDYRQDGSRLSRHVEDCFFAAAGATQSQLRLRGTLEEAHSASGFRPRPMPGVHNGLIDPGEMMARVFYLWARTRWPGRNGRVRYAHTLFNLYIIRSLELLTMRLWDAGSLGAGDRLSQVQGLLDRLWAAAPPDQPVFVRDARWLIQLAQSPATDDLGAYFAVAEQVSETLSEDDRIEIHKAGVRMTGGHLRSQTRYYTLKKGVPIDDTSVVSITRTSNALDFALLIRELVPLLEAYERSCRGRDREQRLRLADAICQGISPDPELFLNRVELLAAYSMIEHLFVTADHDGQVVYTPTGRRHVQLVQEYVARIGRIATELLEDCGQFRPVAGAYSPYGVLYGFSSHLIEHMALKASQPDAVTHLGLEDVFVGGGGDKLAWVNGWRTLPHLTRDVQRQFDYPQPFAEQIFNRIENALRTRASSDATAGPTGRLFIVTEDGSLSDGDAGNVPDLPIRFIGSSDVALVAAQKAEYRDEAQLSSDRREGRCVVGYSTPGGSVGISKALLTEVLATGEDAKIAGLPKAAADAVQLLLHPTESVNS